MHAWSDSESDRQFGIEVSLELCFEPQPIRFAVFVFSGGEYRGGSDYRLEIAAEKE